MVRRLVQLAAIESRTDLATRETFDLAALVREEAAELAPSATTRGIEVVLSGSEGPVTITGDPLMLRIALRNVLQNAIDFSPEGGRVGVGVTDGLGGAAEVRVTDQGPGLPDYAKDRVFDRFYSLKNEVTGRKGSGIGLSFVKAAMDLHGGSATLENAEGGGAVAVLRFG
jgi:two-component system sensor histidine kinase CreC